MASEILLEINGHTYHALRFCYEFYRHTDVKGKPVTGLEGGDVHVVLESNADNSLLETMLSDKSRQVPYHSWPDFEPAPICGKIQLIRDNVEIFRELVFEEGYIYRYHESMTADGFPMSILLSISTMRLDINRNVRLDRRLLTTYGFGWMKLSNTIFKQTVKSNQSIRQKDVTPKKSTIHQEEPVVLVTSVKGESKAIVSQTVQYVVTKYNVPNVKDSDRKRVKWVIEVDGQKEYLKEQGETLDLQIKEEWEGKEIIVMPYLKKYTSVISVKTYVGEKLSLFFNGKVLIFRVVENDKILRFNYKAVSGRPLKDGSFDYSKQRQKLPSIGPLPEGNYYIKPQEIQYAKDRTTIDKIIGNIGMGTMPGGERSWGIGRVWIYPQSVIIDGVERGDFSIHGGDTPGSAGCIDLTSNDRSFFDVLEKYKGKCEKISLKVNYGVK